MSAHPYPYPYLLLLATRRTMRASRCLMASSTPALLAAAKWDGIHGSSRHELLKRLQPHIPSSTMLPECRLLTLVDQAIEYQKSNCLFHISDGQTPSLFTDHSCDR